MCYESCIKKWMSKKKVHLFEEAFVFSKSLGGQWEDGNFCNTLWFTSCFQSFTQHKLICVPRCFKVSQISPEVKVSPNKVLFTYFQLTVEIYWSCLFCLVSSTSSGVLYHKQGCVYCLLVATLCSLDYSGSCSFRIL